jgi:hypothetical protein
MTSTETTPEITLTKGDGRYNIAVDGISAAWTYKNADGTWSVRAKDSMNEYINRDNEVSVRYPTRAGALKHFVMWLQHIEPFFMANRQAYIAREEAEMASIDLMLSDYDAWLATR